MGAKADHDLWGQALAYESRYGDCAIDVITEKIDQLRCDGDTHEMEFWIEVTDCLTQLHAINCFVGVEHREGPRGRSPDRTARVHAHDGRARGQQHSEALD